MADFSASRTIGPISLSLSPLALGGSLFGPDPYAGTEADALLAAMQEALDRGVNHFDTASGYGNGGSETLIGAFAQGRRDRIFLASKADLEPTAAKMLAAVDASRARLRTDVIDLYYIHWPRTGVDLRPAMEGLEQARAAGKIRAVGVSNFSIAHMEQASEAGRIDAHQLGYNLFWRFPERDVIPYCAAHGIAVVTYASLAMGILAGKFGADPQLRPGDPRASIVLFDPAVWPYVHTATEQMKQVAAAAGRPLAQLALRWVLAQPHIHTAVVSARTPEQAAANSAALAGECDPAVFAALSEISDAAMRHMPNVGNMYRYYP